MRRGEVWWAELPRPVGRRPVVLLSCDEAYAVRELVTVAPVTTRPRRIPVEVPLGREEGLPRRCAVNLDTITTVPKSTLAQYAGALGVEKMRALDAAIAFALGLA